MTFNIRLGAGRENPLLPMKYLGSSKEKLEKIARAIKSVDPDVIALQEVRGSKQAELLAAHLNLYYTYLSHGIPDFDWGLAILSKFNISECNSNPIYFSKTKPREGLVCVIDVNNNPITFINVHYYLGAYDRQVKATMKLLMNINGPVVLMGDLNLVNQKYDFAPVLKKLIDTSEAVDTRGSRAAKQTGTFRFGSRRIDYIFVDPQHFEVKDAGLMPSEHREVSDHIAYFACVVPKNESG